MRSPCIVVDRSVSKDHKGFGGGIIADDLGDAGYCVLFLTCAECGTTNAVEGAGRTPWNPSWDQNMKNSI